MPVARFYYLLIGGIALLSIVLCGPVLLGGDPLQSFRLSLGGHALKASFLFEAGVFMMIVGSAVAGLVGSGEPD